MLCALTEFRVRGLKTNIRFLCELLSHPTFIHGNVWTTFIDDSPELFKNIEHGNRGQKLLLYLGEMSVNGTKVVGQQGLPLLQKTPEVIIFNKVALELVAKFDVKVSNKQGLRVILLEKGVDAFCKAVRY
jgi:pyruvate carboxylase